MTIDQIKSLIDDTVDTTVATYLPSKKVRAMNKAQDQLVNLILEKDTLSQYDDVNYTDLAEGYLNLSSGIPDYNVKEDENFADLLFIVKVLRKDSSGEYKELRKVGAGDPKSDYQTREVNTSTYKNPMSYRLTGKKIILNEPVTATVANGLKILFVRIPKPIEESDTTREIGLPSTFHYLVALMAAYDYARAKKMESRNEILVEITEGKIRLGLHISRQDKDADRKLVPMIESTR